MSIQLKVFKQPRPAPKSGVPVFAMVRNEMYFLPHLLRHYRGIGVREFWFLDDGSTDGTRDYLMQQPDCGVVGANMSFGDLVGTRRFGIVAKTSVPRALLSGRWVLTVDADEFLVLPPEFATLEELTASLDGNGLKVARAIMLDFFPETLRVVEDAPLTVDPFALCPYFDALSNVEWADGEWLPKKVSLKEGVRARMLTRLREDSVALGDLLKDYLLASAHKVPLLSWQPGMQMLTAHRCSEMPSDKIQLVLAHFKFYPGHSARIADALARKAYWNSSSEYRFLDIATRELMDWPLQGPRSRRFTGAADLVASGLLFSRLEARKT